MIREWNEESLDHRNTLLYAMGISEEDAKRPVIGLVNSWNEMNPGHFPFDKGVIAVGTQQRNGHVGVVDKEMKDEENMLINVVFIVEQNIVSEDTVSY